MLQFFTSKHVENKIEENNNLITELNLLRIEWK